jgi:two-component system cell cycle sensor histidine kinase/response regulator CckA
MASTDPRPAYNGLPVMIWTSGPDRLVDYDNERWLDFSGHRQEEELGWGWIGRIHPDDRDATISLYNAAFDEERPFELECRIQRSNGEYRWIRSTAVPRRGAKGEFAGFVGSATDVTESHALEERLKRMERTDATAQLAGGVAHDFNNLLTGILGHVTLLLEDNSLSLEARSDLLQIQRSADRAAGLTRQLLAFSRRQVRAPRVLDLNRLVSGTVSAIRSLVGSRIEVFQVLDRGIDPVLGDPGQLEQILLLLSNNAREAMPDGGRLEIATGAAHLDAAAVAGHAGLAAGTYVTLTVHDTGSGLGRGLESVYGIVKQGGGYIGVDAIPGVGTTFTVYLRRAEASALSARKPDAASVLSGSGTILLVEDEEQVRELGRRVMERAGYTVLTAVDAEAAVALADRHAGHIHLLITDLVLPGVSGRELAARLAIHRPAIKVLYVSGTSDEAMGRLRVLDPGTAFLEKPFSLEALLRKIQHVLGAPEPAARYT